MRDTMSSSDSSVSTTATMTVLPGEDLTLPRRPWRISPTPWSALVGHEYKGGGTVSDPYVVVFIPDDSENPQNYSQAYKWWITIVAATGTLAVTMGSSGLSGAVAHIEASFPGYNSMIYSLVTGIYILGFVLGPFLWAPGSEVFGRRAVYIVTLIPLTAFDAGLCGSQSMTTLLVCRFFAGVFGCSSMTSAGGLISDIFAAAQRGLAMGVFGAMPWLGPVVGPIVGGFLGDAAGWRWVAAVIACFAALLTVLHIVFIPETYAPVLLRARAARLQAATGKVYRCEHDVVRPFSHRELVKTQLQVPFKLMFKEPIVAVLCLYQACIFGILYMQFTSFPLVFRGARGWSAGVSALAFIPVSIGCNLALLYMVFWGNPKYVKDLKVKGYLPPEARLPSSIWGGLLVPIGLFWFAWTCVPVKIHWIVPIIATVPYGAGMVLVFLATQNYLVDAYLPTAASVLAAGTVSRSIVGAILPLGTKYIYDAMGLNWGSSLSAFISLAFTPVPFLLLAYGRRIRRMTTHGRMSDDHSIALAEARTAIRDKAKLDAEKGEGADGKDAVVVEDEVDEVLEDNLSERMVL